MKTAYLSILILFSFTASFSQDTYWQQDLKYDINVRLNDSSKTLDGNLKLNYRNNSSDTLTYIWFHVWPNAFKNDRTAFTDQMLENGNTEFYFSDNNKRGYLNRLDFRVNGEPLNTEDHPYYIDIVKVILQTPLLPGAEVLITTPFHVQLPYNFSRGGYYRKTFQITQWYPKPAVYDKNGWHEMPYLNQGEYYGEFGSYRVEITVPQLYKVAATGLQLPVPEEQKNLAESNPQQIDKLKTIVFQQDSVHDFAWFADKDFIIEKDTMLLQSGRIIQCQVFRRESKNGAWNSAMRSLKTAIRLHSEWVGEYPYPVVSVVDGKMSFEGGMEYPTITIINPDKGGVDELIFHEVGHNWFYGILANNERTYPWMDEGLNSFYDLRYMDGATGSQASNMDAKKKNSENKLTGLNYRMLSKLGYQLMASLYLDQPIDTPADSLTSINSNVISYFKTADWLSELEQRIGRTVFDEAMRNYYQKWKFKHPYPEDFQKAFQEMNTLNLDAWYRQKDSLGFLTKPQKRPFKLAAVIKPNTDRAYNYLFIAPAIGFNNYDGFMAGLLVHNYTVPFSKFQYAVAPLYGFKSKQLDGIGRVSYRWQPQKVFQQVEVFLNAAKFTKDDFTDDGGNKFKLAYHKLVPGLRLEFKEKTARSTLMKYIVFKQFLIKEEDLSFYRDTIQQLNLANKISDQFGVSQLSLGWDQFRKLYPNNGELKLEANGSFGRMTFTGSYFFNYKKKGGINLRLFAGKFFYLNEKTSTEEFETSRFHLNMTGPKGDEDYTYSNYFAGRNEFDGFYSQQIMMRDGAFKVRTDMLSSKVGKTDNWLTAFNLTVDIPDKMNPLSLLPVDIPLRIFADAGTYAEVWEKDATDPRVVFDAGLQISLFWSSLNVYIPLVYSNVYKDYFKSVPGNSFWNRISFSIDVPIVQPKKFITTIFNKFAQ